MEIVLLENKKDCINVRKLKEKFKKNEDEFKDFKNVSLVYFEPHDTLNSVLNKIIEKQNELDYTFHSTFVYEFPNSRYIGILYSHNIIDPQKANKFFNFILDLDKHDLDSIFDEPICTINKNDKKDYCFNNNFYVYEENL